MKRNRVEKRATLLNYREVIDEIGLPVVLLPAFALRGSPHVLVTRPDDLEQSAKQVLASSTIGEMLVQRAFL